MTIEQFIDQKIEEKKQFLNEEGHTNLNMDALRRDIIEELIIELNDILYSNLVIEGE